MKIRHLHIYILLANNLRKFPNCEIHHMNQDFIVEVPHYYTFNQVLQASNFNTQNYKVTGERMSPNHIAVRLVHNGSKSKA